MMNVVKYIICASYYSVMMLVGCGINNKLFFLKKIFDMRSAS